MASGFNGKTHFLMPIETWIGGGYACFIHEVTGIAKFAKPNRVEYHLIECDIYARLGRHPRIVHVQLASREGQSVLVLEKMDMSLRELLYLRWFPLPQDTVLLYAEQLAEAYKYVHSKGVYHSDIGAYNVLVGASGVKLCDFGGSSLDGSQPLVAAGIRAYCPWREGPTIETELFSLGSLLYELSVGRQAHEDRPREDVRDLFMARQFPATHHLILGSVMKKCWNEQYQSAEEVLTEIKSIRERHRQDSATVRRRRIEYGSILLSVVGGIFLWKRWNR